MRVAAAVTCGACVAETAHAVLTATSRSVPCSKIRVMGMHAASNCAVAGMQPLLRRRVLESVRCGDL